MNLRTTLTPLAILVGLAGCERCQREQPVPEKRAAETTPTRPTVAAAEPPAEQRARALPLLAGKLPLEPAGTLDLEGVDPTPVRAVSLARCRDGVALVPVLEADGKLSHAEPFILRLDGTPIDGKPHEYIDPRDISRSTSFTFSSLSPERVQGTIRSTGPGGTNPRTLTVDATPLPGVSAPGLGSLGCYSTGFYSLSAPDDVHGFAVARFTTPNLFEINLPLDDDHALTVLARIEPRSLALGPFIDVDLARVFADPNLSDVRVFFETRTAEQLGDAPEALPYSGWERIPVERGRLELSVQDTSWRPIVSIALTDLTTPKGYIGPLAGAEAISARATARFINPRQDHLATSPAPPDWWRRP